MVSFKRLLKWTFALCLLTVIQEKKANIFAAAICSPPCFLFSNTTDIIAVDYKTSAVHSVVTGLTRAVALDVHFEKRYIFWSDVSERNIKRSGIDGSSITTIITNVGVCDGLAVQWRTSELYWSDTSYNKISKSDLSGNNQRVLVSSGLDEPRDIALDPDNGFMFWTDWGSSPKIERATLAASQRVTIVRSYLYWPNGIELDTGNKRMYWVEAGWDRIESADYHGNNRILLRRVRGYHPFGLALVPPFLFSTDWALRSKVHKIDAATGAYVISSLSVTGRPMGIVAYSKSRQPSAPNACAVSNGGCSHFCVAKTSGHDCVCPAGLVLKSDGKTCEDKAKKFLLFTDADAKATYMISLDASHIFAKSVFYHLGKQRPIAVDYDPVEDRVYWTDVAVGRILSAFSNATSMKSLFNCNVKVPDGLAIDNVGQNIYWTDTGTNRIEVARLDGTKRKVLFKNGLDEPRALVLDERNGMMYWTDWGSTPKIENAGMDGSSRQTIVTGSLGWPNGLTIDQTTNLLYWADAKLDKIEVSNLNGGNRRVIMSSSTNIFPFGLTVYKGVLYWTDWKDRSISRYDISTGKMDLIINGLRKPMDIHLYDSSVQVSGSHPCAVNNGLCSDLCLLKPHGSYQCACPSGIALKSDGKTCDYDTFKSLSSDKFLLFAEGRSARIYKAPLAVPETPCSPLGIKTNISRPVAIDYDPIKGKVYWSDVTLKQIVRSYPNGSDLEVIAERNVQHPDGIAVDWIGRNVYWSDYKTSKIEVSRLDGSYRFSLITSGLDNPRALILDIDARKMYWSDWGTYPKIERANMDGSSRTTLVSSGLRWVNSLALDFKKRLLYWCDARLDKIERVDLQGNNRKVIMDLSSHSASYHPFGLALFEDTLFWSDWLTENVHKYNMTSSVSSVLVYGMYHPMEIHIHDHKTLPSGSTSCSRFNGGCSHICLPNPSGQRCFCPEGVQLKPGDSYICQGASRCPRLSAPSHGRLGPCSNVPGQSCQISCDRGYILRGSNVRTCRNAGTWTGLQTQCTIVTCPALPSPANGARRGCTGIRRETYNTICQFSCHPGYNGFGSARRTCLQSGSWSGQNFVCQAVTCPVVVTPIRAVLLTPSCKRTYGSRCTYSCQTGYTSSTGNVTRTCLASGQWSGNEITCKDVDPPSFGSTCPSSPLIAYGEREKFSALVTWTEPVAADSTGVSPTVTSNYQSPTRFRQGTHVITYTAVDQSGNKASCSFTVQVLVINCTSLTVNPNGPMRMSSCDNHYGSKCNFSCDIGHQLNGSSTVTCVTIGNRPPGFWDSPIPVCQIINCPALTTPPKAVPITLSCTGTYGSNCSYSCQTGYTSLTGNVTRTCLSSGNWSGSDIRCTDVDPPSFRSTCPSSPLIAFAEREKFSTLVNWTDPVATDSSGVSPTVTSNYQSPTRFSQGLHVIIYTAVDQSGNKANCNFTVQVLVINCTSLGVTPGSPLRMSSCGNNFGSTCNFSCDIGHQLNGSSTLTCVTIGNRPPAFWDSPMPVCQIINCPQLTTPPKAVLLNDPCTSIYGSNCSYSCQTGYTSLTGNVTRTCLSSGNWSGSDVRCLDIDPPTFGSTCPSSSLIFYAERDKFLALVNWTEPVAADSSGVSPLMWSNHRSPARFSQGTHLITYTAEDQSGNKATCNFTVQVLVINCTSLSVNPNGPLRMSSCGNHYGSKCNFSCDIGHHLSGSSTLTCVTYGNRPSAFWDNPLPVCQVINCSQLITPHKGILLTVPCKRSYRSNCSYSCQLGYASLIGNVTRTCLSSGKWSGSNIKCTDVEPPSFGSSCLTGPFVAYAERERFSALVNWTVPGAIDNSGEVPTVTSDYYPPRRFSQGTHVITYTALDQSGNNATCTFTIEVIVINCTMLTVDPGSPLLVSNCGNNFGSKCNFSCAIGHRLNGSSTLTCVAPGSRPPGFWDNSTPVCQIIKCPSLVIPPKALLSTIPCSTTYGSNCSFSCQSGYSSLTGNVTRTCLASGEWSGNAINCTDVEPPSFGSSCPTGPVIAYAERDTFSALVNWTEPVATDNSGLTPKMRTNYHSPQKFGKGAHVIVYSAMDQSGNKATCTFTVVVTVINCTTLTIASGSPLRMNSCGNHFGSKCNFSCVVGHRLNGSSVLKCVAPGNRPPGFWDNPMPFCEVISCPVLDTPPKSVLLTIPCARTYGSKCSFTCQTGYSSLTGNVTRTCLASGLWSGNNINCSDILAPSFGVTCPSGPLLVYARRDSFSALVNWTEPVATDNSGVKPRVTSNYQSPQWFRQGTHVIRSTALDQSGNKATCVFTVTVIVITCTPMTVDPKRPLRMNNCSYHYGSKCIFSCAVGYRLNGSSTVTCDAPREIPPGAWDNPIPMCQVIRCPSLPIPANGVKTGCLNPLSERYGTICSFSCNVGYNFTGSTRRQCLENRTWSGTTSFCQVINCSALAPPANGAVSPRSCLSRSTYAQTCSFSCVTAGYVLEGTSARVCGGDGKWSGKNDSLCKDNTPPSFNGTCPRNLVAYVPECSSSTVVSWNEPMATDNSGHVIINHPTLRPPVNLSIGLYSLHYSAKDGEGNIANCTFLVQVAGRSCAVLKAPKYGTIASLSCGWLFGSQVLLSCNVGYHLLGSAVRSCKEDGRWSGNKTSCQIVSCAPLVTPTHAVKQIVPCPNTYGSNCSFSCQTGYTSPKGNVTRTCLASGKWSRSGINCTDIHPPTFGASCPTGPLVAYAERGIFSALVNWTEPVAIDTSRITPVVTSNYRTPQRFSQGSHVVTYTAVDQSGNRAKCSFTIEVLVINCTSMTVTPRGPLRMGSCADHYGSKCNFSCTTGYRLNGSSTVTCIAPGNRPPGFWDSPMPVCQVIRCPSLSSPANGIKMGCSNPLSERYGTICSFSCKVGYNLTGSQTRKCLENEQWSGLLSYCQVINCSALAPPANGAVSPLSCSSRSTYSKTCRFSCVTAGYVLEGTSARVCGGDGKWSGKNDTLCRDNTPPSFSDTCTNNTAFYAPKCSSSAVVTWKEPIASDNSGHVTISYPAIRPPVNLSIGLYNVRYSAADAEGNRANCSFIVQVSRKSCPALYSPLSGSIVSQTCGSLFGSQATLACNKGHRLSGSRVRSCQEDGAWSGRNTSCSIVKCPGIKSPSHGMVVPSLCKQWSGVNYNTDCSFTCNTKDGYQLDGPRRVSCLENGSWSGDTSKIRCKDIKPPTIQCPEAMEVPTASGKPYAVVMWKIPVTKDNSIGRLNLSGLDPPQTLQVGTTNITYYVTDSAGLGSSCTFSVLVKDLEPPRFASCPNDTKIISLTRVSKLMLPAVVATDNVGVTEITTSISNGTEVEWGEYEVTYTASDKAKNIVSCSFDVTIADSYCEKLSAPENGAIICESWMARLMCTVHCNEGHDMAFQPRPWFYCESDGNWRRGNKKWSKKPTVPECSGKHKPKIIVVSGRYYYLTNKCSSEQLNEEIVHKFIGILKSTTSEWGQACRDYPHLCTIEDVEVSCGESRVERDVIGKNQTANIPLTISFMLKIPLLSYNNVSLNLNQTIQRILSNILGALVNLDLTFNTSGVVFQRDPSRLLEMRLFHLICDEGQVLVGEVCVNCPLGYYFNGSSCEACAVDHYQDQEAQTSCIACPSGKSTSGEQASKRLQDCQEMPQASASAHQGLSKPVFISIIAAAVVLVVVLISVGICYTRKRCGGTQRSTFDKDIFPIGFANMAYGDWVELSPNDLLDSSEA